MSRKVTPPRRCDARAGAKVVGCVWSLGQLLYSLFQLVSRGFFLDRRLGLQALKSALHLFQLLFRFLVPLSQLFELLFQQVNFSLLALSQRCRRRQEPCGGQEQQPESTPSDHAYEHAILP